jgi:hypothetical protein
MARTCAKGVESFSLMPVLLGSWHWAGEQSGAGLNALISPELFLTSPRPPLLIVYSKGCMAIGSFSHLAVRNHGNGESVQTESSRVPGGGVGR